MSRHDELAEKARQLILRPDDRSLAVEVASLALLVVDEVVELRSKVLDHEARREDITTSLRGIRSFVEGSM